MLDEADNTNEADNYNKENGVSSETSMLLHARQIHVISFPFFKVRVHEISDCLSIIDINSFLVACPMNPKDSRAMAANMLVDSVDTVLASIATFMENDLNNFIEGATPCADPNS